MMLRTRALEVSLWEAVLPEEVLRLPEELARVDALLDDPVFFAPFTPFFDPRLGRPSTPMEVYLRLMFLKRIHGPWCGPPRRMRIWAGSAVLVDAWCA